MSVRTPPDWVLAASLRMSGLTYKQIAAQLNAASGESVRQGLRRHGLANAVQQHIEDQAQSRLRLVRSVVERTIDTLKPRSDALRERFAGELERTSEALAKIAPKPSYRALSQRVAVLEPLARTAKVVHDWGSDKPTGVILVGAMDRSDQVDCGVDATIPSVPGPSALPENTTSSQAIDVEELGSS